MSEGLIPFTFTNKTFGADLAAASEWLYWRLTIGTGRVIKDLVFLVLPNSATSVWATMRVELLHPWNDQDDEQVIWSGMVAIDRYEPNPVFEKVNAGELQYGRPLYARFSLTDGTATDMKEMDLTIITQDGRGSAPGSGVTTYGEGED